MTKQQKGDNVIHVDFGALQRARSSHTQGRDHAWPREPSGEKKKSQNHIEPESSGTISEQETAPGQKATSLGITQSEEGQASLEASAQGPEPLRPADPGLSLYRRKEVAMLFSMTEGRLRYWQKTKLIVPSVTHNGQAFYTFQDLVSVRTVKELLAKGISAQRVRSLVESLRATIPELQRPLTEMRIITDGQDIAVRDETGSYEPVSGQRLLDFRVEELQSEVVTELRPTALGDVERGEPPERAAAYAYYLEGCRLDEDEATWRQAESAYLSAIDLDPTLSNAITNLGNLRYRQRRLVEAEALYLRALEVEPGQPEGLYNLGFLQFERGAFHEAAASFEEALSSEPAFADAHFNLAMVQEELGDEDLALSHWEAYLELEPNGPWAEVARRHKNKTTSTRNP